MSLNISNSLRQVIQTALSTLKESHGVREVSYRLASDDAMYPHIVYHIDTISPTDMGRNDFLLDIDIWDKGEAARALEIADAVRALFAFWNAPQEDILPTFYDMSSGQVDDPDKTIVHYVIRIQGQVYKKEITNGWIIH